jgi:hypothetical protein
MQLAAVFSHFARHECPEDPLYSALCRIVAGSPAMLDLLNQAPREQQRPNLWLAAVHQRVLAGARHPLHDYFISVKGERRPDQALAAILGDFIQRELSELRELIRSRSTQTNEIGRCAILWPALQEISRRHHATDLALLDVGCSAGLNLGVDHYRYEYPELALGAESDPDIPIIPCDLIGPRRPQSDENSSVRLVRRLGIDPAPIDVNNDDEVGWLRACIWPGDKIRAERFAAAVALARQYRWPVRQEADCSAALEPWLDSLPAGVLPVIFNSWVLTYFESAALQRHVEIITALVRTRGAVWLSAEASSLRIGPFQNSVPETPTPTHNAPATLWTMCSRIDGEVCFELLARSHAHGRWMEWLASNTHGKLREALIPL